MRGHFRRLVATGLERAGIRTGLRWKLSAAIALVGALVAVALSLVVHNAARVSMLDNARDLADERIMIAQRNFELSGRMNFPNTKIDDPDLPVAYTGNEQNQVTVTRRMVQLAVTVEIVDQRSGRTLWQRPSLTVDGDYDPGNEPEGRRRALEKLTTDIVDGAQSQW